MPPRLRRFIAGVIVLASPIVGFALVRTVAEPPSATDALGLALFAFLALASDLKPVPLDERGDRSVSLAFLFFMASLILFGWHLTVLMAVVSATVSQAIERRPPARLAFNTAVYALATATASVPELVFGEPVGPNTGQITVYAFVGGAIYVTLNVLLVGVAVSIVRGASLGPFLQDNVRHTGPAFVVMAFLAALTALLWQVDPPATVLVAGPAFALTLYQRSALASRMAERSARTDSLTGIGNLRAYEGTLDTALANALLHERDVALCMVDVDDFKSINDSFGHPVGDAALVSVASVLAECEDASVFRIGGDEFALVVEGSARVAERRIDQARARLEQSPLPSGRPIALSVGIATGPVCGRERDELEQAADRALYLAKLEGKNRTSIFESPSAIADDSARAMRRAEQAARRRAAENLITVVDAKDTYTGAHSQSVAILCDALGQQLGLPADTTRQLRFAGLLHDLGKISIPDRVLQKPGGLDEDELRLMRTHPEVGASMLAGLDLEPADTWIRHHHESWDGTGYPDGLSGEAIPLGSRVILVADAYDAMTSNRSYRSGRTPIDALRELKRLAGTQFDPTVVAALEGVLAQQGSVPAGRLQLRLVERDAA